MATKSELNEKTNAELRQICTDMGIVGMSKKRKDVIIEAILSNAKADTEAKVLKSDSISVVKETKSKSMEPLISMSYQVQSTLTKPNAKEGDKHTTTILVMCGANKGSFPVVGRSVGECKTFLTEALNIPSFPDAVVNGKKVEDGYILRDGDVLEFLKPAGRKG